MYIFEKREEDLTPKLIEDIKKTKKCELLILTRSESELYLVKIRDSQTLREKIGLIRGILMPGQHHFTEKPKESFSVERAKSPTQQKIIDYTENRCT